MSRDGKSTQLRLLVPAALCGAVIGKGGATIRSFAEDSKAAITVSSQDKQPPGVLDRVVRVTGGPEQLLRAVALLLTKLAENPNYARFTSATVSYAAPAVGPAPSAPFAASLPAVPTSGSGPKGQQRVEVTVSVPEGRVGAVIGKGGEVRVCARPPWRNFLLLVCKAAAQRAPPERGPTARTGHQPAEERGGREDSHFGSRRLCARHAQ